MITVVSKLKQIFFLSSIHKYANSVFSSWIPFSITLSEPHDNYPHSLPSIYGKNKISPKIIVCFKEDYQYLVWERGNNGLPLLLFQSFYIAQNRILDKLFHSDKKHSQSMTALCCKATELK